MQHITVELDEHIELKLESEAKQKGVSPSAIVRQLIEVHYREQPVQENCRQLAQELGFIGSAKGLPTDLSTNPDHMEGFGSS